MTLIECMECLLNVKTMLFECYENVDQEEVGTDSTANSKTMGISISIPYIIKPTNCLLIARKKWPIDVMNAYDQATPHFRIVTLPQQ